MPDVVKLPLAEIEAIVNRKLPPTAEARLSPLEQARAALAAGDYSEVFQVADKQNQEGRELAMLEGTAALAQFRETPAPEWNTRALAAFQRAMALSNPNSETEWKQWTDGANSAASVLVDLSRYSEAEPLLRQCLKHLISRLGPDHPDLAIALNNLATLLSNTNRPAEAEPLYRRALAIEERSYGPGHTIVAAQLSNLALLLKETSRPTEAEPLWERAIQILARFQRSTGHVYPGTNIVLSNYRLLLTTLKRSEDETTARIRAAQESKGGLAPITPIIEARLGAASPVAEVLADLDEQYKREGKPAVYFLHPSEPIAAHLEAFIKPNAMFLQGQGVGAYRSGRHADAVAFYDAALGVMDEDPKQSSSKQVVVMNRAAALRELGLVERARDELEKGFPDPDKLPRENATLTGRARYHLALCAWQLDGRDEAVKLAEASLAASTAAPAGDPTEPALRKQSEDLLADLKAGKAPPPMPKIDANAALDAAHTRYRARVEFTKLPLDQKTEPLLDQMLGPAKSTKEVLDALDDGYRKANRPAVWFLPLDRPIAPELDELLGKPTK